MSYFSFTAEQRSRLRSALVNHPSWPNYARTHSLSSATMKVDDMTKAAEAFGIDLKLYGTLRGAPVPKPYGPEVLDNLNGKFLGLLEWLTESEQERFRDIRSTSILKQESRLSERQWKVLSDLLLVAEGRKLRGETPPAGTGPLPAPAPEMEETEGLRAEDEPETYGLDEEEDEEETKLLQRLLERVKEAKKRAGISEERVVELIKTHGGKPPHVTLDLRTPHGVEPRGEALMHYRFPLLLSAIRAGVNVMLVGPAGSGKTTACEKAAELLGLPFYFTGAIDSPYKLLGFKTAQGETVRTPFREAFEHGGFFLFDEMDSSLPAAVTPFNAAQANRIQDFPDSIVKAHERYIGIAACNTYGRGASREYVGRFQQDAAVLDRYVMLSWDYDSALEAAMLGQPRPEKAPAPASISPVESAEAASVLAGRWLERVRTVRERIEKNKVRHVVSPRASVAGAKLLSAGWPWKEVEEAVLWKGLDTDARAKCEA